MASIAISEGPAQRGIRQAGLIQALLIVCITALPTIAVVSLVPTIPLLLHQFGSVPHASVVVPLIVTAPGICIALLAPFSGMLADRIGRRPMALGALILYGFAGSVPLFVDDVYQVIASRLVLGMAESVLVTVGYSLISDYYPPEQRRKWLALQAALGSVVGAALTFLGGMLAELGWRGPFAIYLAAFLIFAAALRWLWEPTKQQEDVAFEVASGGAFPWRAMALVVAVTLFSATLFYGYIIQIGIALERLGLTSSGKIGIITGLAALAVIVGAMLSRFVIKFPPGFQFFIVFGILGLGLVGIGLAHSWQVAALAAVTQQFGAGFLIPVLVALTHSFLGFEHRNRGTGIWAATFFLGQFTCPLAVAGIRMVVPDAQQAIAALGACSIAAALIALAAAARRRSAAV